MQFYHLKLSDGDSVTIRADSAAVAIYRALRDYRGRTVLACYSGTSIAYINFEVPKHEAMPPKKKRKVLKTQTELFDVNQIEYLSDQAQKIAL